MHTTHRQRERILLQVVATIMRHFRPNPCRMYQSINQSYQQCLEVQGGDFTTDIQLSHYNSEDSPSKTTSAFICRIVALT